MLVPELYRAPRRSWVLDLIRGHPLALLITADSGTVHASHVPVLVGEETPELVLLGHLNRHNPHHAVLATAPESLLVFTGPSSYVSPSWYPEPHPASPTWNFAVVHVRGPVRMLDQEGTRTVVRRTAAELEKRWGRGWDPRGSYPYFEQLLPAVAGFSLTGERVEDMFKLSQDKPEEVRGLVAAALAGADGGGPGTAALMNRMDGDA